MQSSKPVQPCSGEGRKATGDTERPFPRGAGRNSSVQVPKAIPGFTLHSRLPAREIKRVPGGRRRREANRPGENTPFLALCWLLPLELRQEFDPSWDFWGALPSAALGLCGQKGTLRVWRTAQRGRDAA